MLTYEFACGEDIAVALDAVQGDPAQVTAITADLKLIPAGRAALPDNAARVASFAITSRAATASNDPGGWTLLIPAVVSATLVTGSYVADAKLIVANGTAYTSQIGIRLRKAVTA